MPASSGNPFASRLMVATAGSEDPSGPATTITITSDINPDAAWRPRLVRGGTLLGGWEEVSTAMSGEISNPPGAPLSRPPEPPNDPQGPLGGTQAGISRMPEGERRGTFAGYLLGGIIHRNPITQALADEQAKSRELQSQLDETNIENRQMRWKLGRIGGSFQEFRQKRQELAEVTRDYARNLDEIQSCVLSDQEVILTSIDWSLPGLPAAFATPALVPPVPIATSIPRSSIAQPSVSDTVNSARFSDVAQVLSNLDSVFEERARQFQRLLDDKDTENDQLKSKIQQIAEAFQDFMPKRQRLAETTRDYARDLDAIQNIVLDDPETEEAEEPAEPEESEEEAEEAEGLADSDHCFLPGTLIPCYDGTYKTAEALNMGDRVMSDFGSPLTVSYSKTHGPRVRKIVELFAEDAGSLSVTAEHRIVVPGHREAPAGTLKTGNLVMCSNGLQNRLQKVNSFRCEAEVVELRFEPDEPMVAFLPPLGILTLGQSRRRTRRGRQRSTASSSSAIWRVDPNYEATEDGFSDH